MLRKIRAHLDVYGKIKDKTGSFKNEILYTGRWLDDDTGFMMRIVDGLFLGI